MASPLAGIGTGLKVSIGGSYAYRIVGARWSGMQREKFESTHMSQANATGATPPGEGDAAATYVFSAVCDPGEIQLDCLFDPDQATLLSSAAASVVITYGSTASWTFSGVVTAEEPTTPHKGVQTQTVTIKALGPITVAAGTGG